MKASEFVKREISTINRTFRNHRVDAGCKMSDTLVGGRTVILYRIRRGQGVRVADVNRLLPEISEAVGAWRGKRTPVRVQTHPHALELPHPRPQPVMMSNRLLYGGGGHRMLCGVSYGYAGEQKEAVSLDDSPHILIAGTTGAGKSVLERGMLLSLAANTGPDDLRLVLVDMKNNDLVTLQGLPHTERFAYRAGEAAEAIAAVHAEMQRRLESKDSPYRLVLAIDELARLSEDKKSMALLNDILATGRSLRVNVLAATQHPTRETLGKLQTVNFAERFVGLVVNANTAQFAAGRPETHAHMLPGRGAFLRIAGAEMRRFQAFFANDDAYADGVRNIARRAGSVATRTTVQPLPMPAPKRDAVDDLADKLAPMVAQGMSKRKMSLAALDRTYAGGAAAKLNAALERLDERATTSDANARGDATEDENTVSGHVVAPATNGQNGAVSVWY